MSSVLPNHYSKKLAPLAQLPTRAAISLNPAEGVLASRLAFMGVVHPTQLQKAVGLLAANPDDSRPLHISAYNEHSVRLAGLDHPDVHHVLFSRHVLFRALPDHPTRPDILDEVDSGNSGLLSVSSLVPEDHFIEDSRWRGRIFENPTNPVVVGLPELGVRAFIGSLPGLDMISNVSYDFRRQNPGLNVRDHGEYLWHAHLHEEIASKLARGEISPEQAKELQKAL